MKIKFLFDQNQTISGHAIHFEKGEIADIPDIEADLLISGLCAELVEDKPTETEKPKRGKKSEVIDGTIKN